MGDSVSLLDRLLLEHVETKQINAITLFIKMFYISALILKMEVLPDGYTELSLVFFFFFFFFFLRYNRRAVKFFEPGANLGYLAKERTKLLHEPGRRGTVYIIKNAPLPRIFLPNNPSFLVTAQPC